jgi:hypothetical protein
MKIVQSFWTKPFLNLENTLMDTRFNGGWPGRRYNYFSWALSCLQLRKFYTDVELVTDDLGKFLLIEKIGLPYTNVSLELNKLSGYNSGLWALGKIKAYSIQETPFLHVDNDVFIWNAFDHCIHDASLVAQNLETTIEEAARTLDEVVRRFSYIPPYLKQLEGSKAVHYSNAGVLGGADISFFAHYTGEIFDFIHRNRQSIDEHIESLNLAWVNVIYEQMIFNQLAKLSGNSITHLFPEATDIPRDIEHFHAAHHFGGYMHCCGSAKRNRLVYEMLDIKLRTGYPDYYERIMDQLAYSEI